MASRRAPQRRSSSRKGTNWARFVFAAPVTIPAASKAIVLTLTLDNPGIAETIVRSIGRFFVQSDQALVVEQQLGAWGGIVTTDAAVAAGAASIPGPSTDASDDGWFVWEAITQNGQLTTGGPSGFMVNYESKGARRVQEGFTIAFMVENAHATHGLQFSMAISLLSVVNT